MDCDSSVVDLPLSDPLCVQAMECCTAFYAGKNASQTATPYLGQFAYGHWTTYYGVTIVGLLTIRRIYCLVSDGSSSSRASAVTPNTIATVGLPDKARALGRLVSYRSLAKGTKYSCIVIPRAGLLVFLVVTIGFLAALVFAEKPYYRPQFGFGSPPIAIRTGLMAYACVPILVALAGKANIVTLLTGISHERLNVVHQWVAWMSFALSLIHTIPFFVASVQEPGDGGFQKVKSEFYRNNGGPLTEVSESGIFDRPDEYCLLRG